MALPPEVPDSIRQEIAIYLGADERILKVISSMSERIEAVGEVWLILTNLSVFFFTRRHGREPVVALLARKDIREIEYFEKINGIVLTFVPERNPASSTRLSFPLSRKESLEDFCEDLADLIRFKKETPAGVKSYKQDAAPGSHKPVQPAPSSATKTVTEPAAKTVTGAKPTSAAKVLADGKVRIVQGAQSAPDSSPPKKVSKTQSVKAAPAQNKTSELKSPSDNSACLYVVMATSLSILVGFIWYKFFRMLVKKS